MKTKKKILIALLLLATLAASAAYLFKTLDARDGLTSSQINCILKDSRGYVWFGTPAGLYRYDGYTFKNFQCDSQDGSSLPDSYIESLQEALDGSLWVKTPAGYCIYHPQTESFERNMKQEFAKMGIERQPEIVYIDRHKNLWGYIPNKGVVCYNMQQQLLYEFGYTNDSHGVPQGIVCSIGECRDGAVIVYDDGRLVCCDVMHQQHTVWSSNDVAQRKLRRTSSLRIYTDAADNIWLYGQGTLFVYNRSTDTWNTSVGDQFGLTGIGVDNAVNGIVGDSTNIWIGTDRNGLIRMDLHTRATESVQPTSLNSRRPASGVIGIQSLYIDNTHLLWVGTEKSGVALWGKNIYKFETELNGDITAMAQDASGRVWYGTSDNGVIGYDGPLASLKVSAMACTSDGSLWVGSRQNGLTRIKDGQVTFYSLAKDSMRTLIDDHINALNTDKTGNLWIATDGGLQVYNPRMNSFSSYTRENGKLTANNITDLHYATNNRMLIGTGEGLVVMNLSTAEMTHLTGNSTSLKKFTNNYVTQVYEDSRGLIWVGTREGVNILNLMNDTLNYLTEKQGLCNNNVCGITEDKSHCIWVTTSNGVSRVVVQRNHENDTYNYGLYNYNSSDGLQSNEFNPGSILTRENDGNVVLGGLYGINWVRPKTAEESEKKLTVMLTQLFIGEEEIQTGHEYDGRVTLPQALNESRQLELTHSQNTFTIKFAGGNYNQSERLQFVYWMEGLDNDWRNGDALTHGVTFRKLKSGSYTLHVKAVSAEGKTSNEERSINITIDHHWLLSWWMLLFYAIVIIIVLYVWKIGIERFRDIWSKKRAVINELKRQREEIKATSDDLRQPMARMTSIIGNLSERNVSLEEREQLNALHSQMLQVITRVSDMQTALEHPEDKAKESVHTRFEMNSKGEMSLPDDYNEELTAEIRPRQADAPTKKFFVMFIDDNEEFIKFTNARLKYVYDFHPYDDTRKAAEDLEVMLPDLVICKQDMKGMTGSELCNRLKMTQRTEKVKFVLMTDRTLRPQDMKSLNITLAADDYLAKPFNMQEAVLRFNKLLGIGPIEMDSNLIEGAETRMLEDLNSSMTTATESINMGTYNPMEEQAGEDDEMNAVEVKIRKDTQLARQGGSQLATQTGETLDADDESYDYMGEYSMADAMDRQLLKNIEQYVLQNMSRGQISLEQMASAMGMGRVPFFHKVRNITGKTPAELVRDLRLKHSCILLKRTNINMSELATNVGFMTGENFINVFKEKFGISPLEYRLKHRNNA